MGADKKVEQHRSAVAEYLLWAVAWQPFQLPWMLFVAYMSKGGLARALHGPPSWSPRFASRLASNVGQWLSSYVTAWVVFQLVRRRRLDLKYNAETPPTSFVLTEAARSLGGIVVLTAYQGLCRARKPGGASLGPRAQAAWSVALLLWADFHFYATHRLLHAVPALYRHVHKVHHRSKNVDPWSGLSMHPIEHLVFFSALLPLLAVPAVPMRALHALSTGLILGPIPSHIGVWPFERQHWEHHVEFNYNYGSSCLFDTLFGTTYEAYERRRRSRTQTAADLAREREAARQRELTVEAP